MPSTVTAASASASAAGGNARIGTATTAMPAAAAERRPTVPTGRRWHATTASTGGTDRRPAVRHTHHLELTVADTPLVLDRIVSLCRTRRCAIAALRFEAADRHRPGRVLMTIEADATRARLAKHNLASMPGVLAVATTGARRGIGAAA